MLADPMTNQQQQNCNKNNIHIIKKQQLNKQMEQTKDY